MSITVVGNEFGVPVVIDGFRDASNCEQTKKHMHQTVKGYKSGECIMVTK